MHRGDAYVSTRPPLAVHVLTMGPRHGDPTRPVSCAVGVPVNPPRTGAPGTLCHLRLCRCRLKCRVCTVEVPCVHEESPGPCRDHPSVVGARWERKRGTLPCVILTPSSRTVEEESFEIEGCRSGTQRLNPACVERVNSRGDRCPDAGSRGEGDFRPPGACR